MHSFSRAPFLAPHVGVYTPIYVAAEAAVPPALSRGSLFKFDSKSAYWRFAAVGNWVRGKTFICV